MRTFGEYLKSIRKEQCGVTQIYLAKQLGISVSWLSDVESGRRYGFDAVKCKKISDVLHLDEIQSNALLTLSGETRSEIPLDLTPYIRNSPCVIQFLRTARDLNLTQADWHRLTAELQTQFQKDGDTSDA